ncbi:MAG: hypothetical protein L3J91_06170 [Thermoplasmata archaeon]|nr:hypothetical protein [Thermoplasmata archaeon]
MRRPTPTSLHDRHQTLLDARADAEAEEAHLLREEEYLSTQIRQAEEQVRHYQSLLVMLRKDWGGKSPPFYELVRKLK